MGMGLSHEEIDNFFRLYRISGMAHCGVGGISGAGAWMFGQSGAASAASNNIVHNLVNWVENDDAPDTLLGTKFWYETPSMGIESNLLPAPPTAPNTPKEQTSPQTQSQIQIQIEN